ncbi:50S ribosomal protein L6 [Mycoplasmoides alvi]|uniref:50S ribosomal protein L6 n=1 Tax=Mycoplasmoides alvi TaxID=78580 RepID=UPI00051C1E99|nr:50S ribosomal protein L6 [Mycoplasmoides alvi]
MSRIGNRVIEVPNGVNIALTTNLINVKGPLGQVDIKLPRESNVLNFKIENNTAKILRTNDLKTTKMLHGTYNALLKNAIIGVTQGFTKQLQLVGVGYRATLKDPTTLNLALGYSHPIDIKIPTGIKVTVDKNTLISITGVDKQLVGEFAIQIRKWRLPEPYKGKGVLYVDEHIIRKAGKTAEGKK